MYIIPIINYLCLKCGVELEITDELFEAELEFPAC